MLFLNTTIDGLQYGLVYAIAAFGMYIAYSILDFPDLTADGTFPLGGVVGTIFIYQFHFPPILALLIGALAGALAGAVTGILHVRFKITKLLSGIIVMTGLLSVTFFLTRFLNPERISKKDFPYIGKEVIDGIFNRGRTVLSDFQVILILLAIVIVVKVILDLFFKTKSGFMLRATGDNEALITSLGKNVGFYKILGLAIANGLMGFSGALYAQYTMYYDNGCGTGKVVLTLASVIIGLAIFSKLKFVKNTTAVIVGAIIYSLCLNYFTLLDNDGTYLKIMNAICFALILIINNFLKKDRIKKSIAPKNDIEKRGKNLL